jgi:hypothetical protein
MSQKFYCKKGLGLCKSIEEKNGHKDVRDIENNRYLDAYLKKREKKEKERIKIAQALAKIFSREICFQGAK